LLTTVNTAEELVPHLNHHRHMGDFTDVVLMFAACECRLTEAKELVYVDDERMDMLWDEIRARKAKPTYIEWAKVFDPHIPVATRIVTIATSTPWQMRTQMPASWHPYAIAAVATSTTDT
jgi:hypothetical protein